MKSLRAFVIRSWNKTPKAGELIAYDAAGRTAEVDNPSEAVSEILARLGQPNGKSN